MPNTFAYVVFFLWPLVVIVLFLRLPVAAALSWSIISGYLLMPGRTGFDFPMVPAIDKDALPSLVAGFMLLIVAGGVAEAERRQRRAIAMPATTRNHTRSGAPPPPPENITFRHNKGGTILWGLVVLACVSTFLTVLSNSDPVVAGPTFIRGLEFYDGVSVLGNLLIILLPFLLARRHLATPESHVTLLKVLCLASLGYSILVLYEVRMSPQLNTKVYGFFAGGSFRQQMRDGGFRAVVFLQHGLWVAIFLAMAMLGTVALWRQARQQGHINAWRWGVAALWLLMTLVLCNSLGALVIALLFLPAVLFAGVRGQLVFAAIIAGAILTYPMLRGSGLVPVQTILSWSRAISEERAASLEYRFRNEDILLARTNEKPLSGWGGFGRNRVFDPQTGRDISTTDGMWIITIGTWGWPGYLAQFGLLVLPMIFLAAKRREMEISYATSGLALVLATNLLDMIPNATLTPLTWLIGGALAGRYSVVPTLKPIKPSPRKARALSNRGPVQILERAPPSPLASGASKVRFSRSETENNTQPRST